MRAAGILMVLFMGVAHAQDTPEAMLRTRLEPPGPVMVGQPVRLHVDVLVTTWLTRAPVFPTFEMDGAMVVLPDERSVNLGETIGGRSWFGVSRSYIIYPQEPREYVIPPIEMNVLPGQSDGSRILRFQRQSFQATIPDEAKDLEYFIPTRNLQIDQALDRDLKGLRAGDSIRRTIRIFAEQTFAMFLPPVKFEEIEGLSVYPDPPQVQDRSEGRIGFQGGERVESAAYVIREEGEYVLPALEVYWWDLGAGRMRKADVEAVRFSAAPNPDLVPEIPLPEEDASEESVPEEKSVLVALAPWLGLTAVALLLLFFAVPLLRSLLRHVRKRMDERRKEYEQSEAAAFDSLKAAVRKGDTASFIRHLYRWIDRNPPFDRISTVGSLSGKNRELDAQLAALFDNRYSGRETDGSRTEATVVRILSGMRGEFRRQGRETRKHEKRLPQLNP